MGWHCTLMWDKVPVPVNSDRTRFGGRLAKGAARNLKRAPEGSALDIPNGPSHAGALLSWLLGSLAS